MTEAAARGAFVALSAGAYALTAPLTFATVNALRAPGLALIASAPAALSIDLQGVSQVDSAGLALLVDWLASARARARQLHYARPPQALRSLARLSDVEQLIAG